MHPTPVQNAGLLVLRLVVGLTFLLHGLDRLGDLSGTEEFFSSLAIPADGGTELVLLLGGASVALALTCAGRFSADKVLDLPRHLAAARTRTRDLTRHSPGREPARREAKVTT